MAIKTAIGPLFMAGFWPPRLDSGWTPPDPPAPEAPRSAKMAYLYYNLRRNRRKNKR